MSGSEMKVQVGEHTARRAAERGTNLEEIEELIRTGSAIPAKYGRMGKAKVFDFRKERNGVYYQQKRVDVYFVMEGETAITVTTYVFYGKWEA